MGHSHDINVVVACEVVTDDCPDDRIIQLQCQLMEVFGRYEWIASMAKHFREEFLPAHPEVGLLLQSPESDDWQRAAQIAIDFYKKETAGRVYQRS